MLINIDFHTHLRYFIVDTSNTERGIMMYTLKVQDIKKSYNKGKKQVLSSVNIEVSQGECVGIVGANGCGKTTLLLILSGVIPADGGQIYYGDALLSGGMFRQAVSYVPQDNPLIEELTARDNLKLWYGNRLAAIEQDSDKLVSLLGVSEFISDRVCHLSGGMKKKLSICCAVAGDQPVLLLDEPGASLDLPCKKQILTYLDYRKKRGALIILSTHEEQEMRFCDRLYLLKDGILGPVDDQSLYTNFPGSAPS